MFTLLAATALVATKFPGGSANDFAAVLAQSANQNVVVVQGIGAAVKPCEFDPSDLNELARAIRNQTQLAILPGTDLIVSDAKINPSLVTDTEGGTINTVPLPKTAIQAGKITFKTEKNDLLAVNSLASVFEKPVKLHWIYNDAAIAVQMKDMPQEDFLKWVSKAVGGRLTQTAAEYAIALDPIEIRRRAINTIMAVKIDAPDKATQTMEEKKRTFRIASLNSLSAPQITQALATQGSETRVALGSNNPLTRTAVAYVQDLAQYQSTAQVEQAQVAQANGQMRMRRRVRGGEGSAVGVLQRVDPSRTAYLIVNSRLEVSFEVPVLNGRGQSGGVVHF